MDVVAIDALTFDDRGLIPAIVQDAETGDILMMAWMNRESVALTAAEGRTVFWSRSRQELWRKGETSGNGQRVVELRIDCDQDALLLKVEMSGREACCHTGRRSCFYRALPVGEAIGKGVALRLIDAERQFDPETVYRHPGAAKGTLKK